MSGLEWSQAVSSRKEVVLVVQRLMSFILWKILLVISADRHCSSCTFVLS